MVIYYPPARLRRDSGDQPTAITDVLIAASQGARRTSDLPLGIPTCSGRTRHGLWALYPSGTEAVVVWPGGALAGPPAEVAAELDRRSASGQGERHDKLDRAGARAIRGFLTDPDAQDGAPWPAPRTRTWSSPTNQPDPTQYSPLSWPGAPTRPRRPLTLPDATQPRRTQPNPGQAPAPQRAA